MVVARGHQGEEIGVFLLNGYRILVIQDERVLESVVQQRAIVNNTVLYTLVFDKRF